ncbi:MAG: F0F1 ATP synthase subunit A [Planctomycetota bacterium]|jgi:F-type H+-transporting ATPase subunit a|nr:F0F1 ATP synthase subunit A [Planctomycetota bacterium]
MHPPLILADFIMHHIVDVDKFQLGSLTVTKHMVMLVLAAGLLLFLATLAARGAGAVPRGRLTHAFEVIILFLRDDVIGDKMSESDRRKFLPYAASVFFFILFCNLIGLVPSWPGVYELGTATGNINVTFGLAALTFFMIHGVALVKHGPIGYFSAVVPSVPWLLWPLLFVIEMAGFVAKAVALTVRLFANMVGGHCVLLGVFSLMLAIPGSWVVFGGSTLLCIPITFLEIFVAFLQAYIFTFLTAIFVAEAAHGH